MKKDGIDPKNNLTDGDSIGVVSSVSVVDTTIHPWYTPGKNGSDVGSDLGMASSGDREDFCVGGEDCSF